MKNLGERSVCPIRSALWGCTRPDTTPKHEKLWSHYSNNVVFINVSRIFVNCFTG